MGWPCLTVIPWLFTFVVPHGPWSLQEHSNMLRQKGLKNNTNHILRQKTSGRRTRHRLHGLEKQAQHRLPATIRDRKENQSTFTITYCMPDPHLMTSCAFTLDSGPVLLTPLSFSDWEKRMVSMRDLSKMLYKCQPLISTLSSSSAHNQLSRQPGACRCSRGASYKAASCARPRGISSIHRHDPGIGTFLFATFRQSLVVLGDHFWQQSWQEKRFFKSKESV